MISDLLAKEWKEEAAITQKFLDRFPEDQLEYKPHEKSMSLKQLTNHLVEIAGWADWIIKTEFLDFQANPYVPQVLEAKQDFQEKLTKNLNQSLEDLSGVEDDFLLNNHWKLTMGDVTIADWTKYEALRHALAQTTHHRAQLGVYYRLLGIPVPGSYGPSADEM